MAKQVKTPVSAAVSAFVAPTAEVSASWRELGVSAAQAEGEKVKRVQAYIAALTGQPYQIWDCFSAAFQAGAISAGYANPRDLYSREVIKPLEVNGLVKPQSPTSSAAREVTPETKAKQDAAKAEREALAKMTAKEVKAEIDAGKATPERFAKLYPALVAAEKRETRDAEKKAREGCAKIVKSNTDIINAYKLDKAMQGKFHAALVKLLPKTPSGK